MLLSSRKGIKVWACRIRAHLGGIQVKECEEVIHAGCMNNPCPWPRR